MAELKVVPFRRREERCDMASVIRKFADEIEAGEFGEVETIMFLIDTPDQLRVHTIGFCPSPHHEIGLLDAAKQFRLGRFFGDDD